MSSVAFVLLLRWLLMGRLMPMPMVVMLGVVHVAMPVMMVVMRVLLRTLGLLLLLRVGGPLWGVVLLSKGGQRPKGTEREERREDRRSSE